MRRTRKPWGTMESKITQVVSQLLISVAHFIRFTQTWSEHNKVLSKLNQCQNCLCNWQ